MTLSTHGIALLNSNANPRFRSEGKEGIKTKSLYHSSGFFKSLCPQRLWGKANVLSWKDSLEGKDFLLLWGLPILAKPKEEILSRAFKDAVKLETWRRQTEKCGICEYPPLGNVLYLTIAETCGHRNLSPSSLLQHRSKTQGWQTSACIWLCFVGLAAPPGGDIRKLCWRQ